MLSETHSRYRVDHKNNHTAPPARGRWLSIAICTGFYSFVKIRILRPRKEFSPPIHTRYYTYIYIYILSLLLYNISTTEDDPGKIRSEGTLAGILGESGGRNCYKLNDRLAFLVHFRAYFLVFFFLLHLAYFILQDSGPNTNSLA